MFKEIILEISDTCPLHRKEDMDNKDDFYL